MKQETTANLPIDVYDTFCERLISIMNERNLRTQDLADKIFVSRSTISDYRSGYRFPNIELLYRLALALNVSADYLLGIRDTY